MSGVCVMVHNSDLEDGGCMAWVTQSIGVGSGKRIGPVSVAAI